MPSKPSRKEVAEQIRVQADRKGATVLRGLASPPRQPKTGEVLAGEIRGMILRRELEPGDCLVPEPQLMEMFSASRASLREAFRILESERFITVRRGVRSGPQIHMPGPEMVARYAGYLLQYERTTLDDLYHIRIAVEPLAARLNAEKSDPDTVSVLEGKMQYYEKTLATRNIDVISPAGLDFHSTMVKLSGSKSLYLTISMLDSLFERHVKVTVKAIALMSEESRQVRFERFKELGQRFSRLIHYIETGEADKAESFWRDYIRQATTGHLAVAPGSSLLDLLD